MFNLTKLAKTRDLEKNIKHFEVCQKPNQQPNFILSLKYMSKWHKNAFVSL